MEDIIKNKQRNKLQPACGIQEVGKQAGIQMLELQLEVFTKQFKNF